MLSKNDAICTFADEGSEVYAEEGILVDQFEGALGVVEVEEEGLRLYLKHLPDTKDELIEVDFSELVYFNILLTPFLFLAS